MTTSTRVEYHHEAKLIGDSEKGWQSSSAWGFNGTKAGAVANAKGILKNGRYGYKARAARVLKYTITTTVEVVWEARK